jgi:hypothetical protein
MRHHSKDKIRETTHWCKSGNIKHEVCGRIVAKIRRLSQGIEELAKDNFEYSRCMCYCHYNKILKKYHTK